MFFKKHKKKIVLFFVLLLVLVFSFFYGENPFFKPQSENVDAVKQNVSTNVDKNEKKEDNIKVTSKDDFPDGELYCTLSVRCDTILQNMSLLDGAKKDLVPGDGVIFAKQRVVFYEGESVFDLLKREMRNNSIHMEFVNTPVYNSAYIEGIANIYEFDCGSLSGWMYKVNGIFPNYGSSRYELCEGDEVEWVYTCDLGKDVGGEYASGNGN